jgi:serine/threonine-protein kinase
MLPAVARFPSRIGRYDLITALATGGMGRVYLGRAAGIGGFERKVVIKTLEVPLTAESDPAIAMFLDEARVLGQLHHQHIAGVYEVGKDEDGRHFMVLDYLEGFSAHDVWERAVEFGAALPLDFTLTVVSAVANGLHYAHTRKDIDGRPLGIVHRDVTPSNVMIGYDGAVKIIDFGIAMATHRSTKTQTGFVKGKVGYLSPEQVSGRDVDARTDVFALGILLYELSTQHRAFREGSDLATMQRIKAGKLTRPSQLVSNYPVELEAIVMKALQVDPIDRFADADAMRRAVEALGHRLHLVLGDAAIIEVMAQLFEPHAPPKAKEPREPKEPKEPPARMSDPSFEWLESDHALTVRREPEELLAQLRNESLRMEALRSDASSSGIIDEAETRQLGSTGMPDGPPRKLRAATEAADALGAQAFDTPMPGLPLASPPPTPVMTAIPRGGPPATPRGVTAAPAGPTPRSMTAAPSGPATPRGMTLPPPPPPRMATAVPMAMTSQQAPLSPPRHGEPLIGATVVRGARKRRSTLVQWVAAGAIAAVLGVGAYFVTRESTTDAVAGSAAPPAATATAPVAARAPTPPPSPPKPVHADPPPPPPPPAKPTQVRVKLVTHPSNAIIMLDGKKLGRTPFDETIDADPGKHVFRLKRKGYTTAEIDVALDGDIARDIALTPQR